MSKTRFASITSAALVAAVLLTAAYAEDSTGYSAVYCKPGSTSVQNVDYPNEQSVGIRNNNAFTVPIVCPVLQVAISNTGGTNAVKVFWTAEHFNDWIVCAVKSVNKNGSIRQAQFSSRFGTGELIIPNISRDDHDGSYLVDCQLPSHGILNTIWIAEKD